MWCVVWSEDGVDLMCKLVVMWCGVVWCGVVGEGGVSTGWC